MKNILSNEENYRVAGRYTVQEDGLYLAFSASYLEFAMKGTRAEAVLTSDFFAEAKNLEAYAAVFYDDCETPAMRFPLVPGTQTYELYDGPEQEIRIRLMKYSEAPFSKFGILEINVEGSIAKLPPEKEKFIEFIGDSITCGYGIEGVVDKDVFCTRQENPWNAYACLTARALNADFSLVSWSGNGIISHYVDPEVETIRNDEPLMPEVYNYADLALERRLEKETLTPWVYDREPDLVVLYLGTNDSSYTRCRPERNAMFVPEYKKFLYAIREKHPASRIICMLGTMDERLKDSVDLAVNEAKAEGLQNVNYLPLPFRDENDGLGTDYHPSPVTQKKVSEMLIKEIGWK